MDSVCLTVLQNWYDQCLRALDHLDTTAPITVRTIVD